MTFRQTRHWTISFYWRYLNYYMIDSDRTDDTCISLYCICMSIRIEIFYEKWWCVFKTWLSLFKGDNTYMQIHFCICVKNTCIDNMFYLLLSNFPDAWCIIYNYEYVRNSHVNNKTCEKLIDYHVRILSQVFEWKFLLHVLLFLFAIDFTLISSYLFWEKDNNKIKFQSHK